MCLTHLIHSFSEKYLFLPNWRQCFLEFYCYHLFYLKKMFFEMMIKRLNKIIVVFVCFLHRIQHDNQGFGPGWFLDRVSVSVTQS